MDGQHHRSPFGGHPGKRHPLPILKRYKADPATGCWVWQGAFTSSGYGVCSSKGKMAHAHRVLYEHHCTAIPAGLQIDHLCRNRACVNPDHLEAVTQAENARRRPTSKLNHEAVAEIRIVTDMLCAKYDISASALAHVVRRSRWRDDT